MVDDDVCGKYDDGAAPADRFEWDIGGCEKAFGCGVNTRSSLTRPRAVEFSSSSSSESAPSEASDVVRRITGFGWLEMSSFELFMTRSDSLSLSSYSSWLLPAVLIRREGMLPEGRFCVRRRRRIVLESCWTRRPVVTTSSAAAEESEDDDG